MKKKTKVILASALGVVLISFFIFLKNYKFSQQYYLPNVLQCLLFDKNFIYVKGDNIDVNKVTIELVDYSQGVVFENGKKVKRIKNEYGGDYFKVFYDNLLIADAWIFKTNWWHTHTYYFEVIKKDSIFDFHFRVKGPNSKSADYKMYYVDKLNRKSTEVFNPKGGKRQINVNYYDVNENIIVDEVWINDTLITLNLYKNGNLHKNYNTKNYSETATYKLKKEPSDDSLKYIYQTIENKNTTNEIIGVKNCH